MANPDVTVIVPVYDDPTGIASCLRALSQQTIGTDRLEVLVVDNGSASPIDGVVGPYAFARALFESTPGSYAARNAALPLARGSILAFTDSDCIPDPTWLEAAVEHLRHHPETSAVAGAIELLTSADPGAVELYERVFSFRQETYVRVQRFGATANLVVRRSDFDRVGPFDARLKSSGDRDWGQRLHELGLRMDFVPQARVRHPTRGSIAALAKKRRRLEGGFRQASAHRRAAATPRPPEGRPSAPAPIGARLLLRPSAWSLTRAQALRVLGVSVVLDGVALTERLRLAFGGQALR